MIKAALLLSSSRISRMPAKGGSKRVSAKFLSSTRDWIARFAFHIIKVKRLSKVEKTISSRKEDEIRKIISKIGRVIIMIRVRFNNSRSPKIIVACKK